MKINIKKNKEDFFTTKDTKGVTKSHKGLNLNSVILCVTFVLTLEPFVVKESDNI